MKIVETNAEISEEILKIFVEQLYEVLRSKAIIIQNKVRAENVKIWKRTATYDSLLHGSLNHEFGFKKGTAETKVNAVLEAMSKNTKVHVKKFRKRGKMYFGFQINTLNKSIPPEIFYMDEASIDREKPKVTSFSSDFAAFSGGQGLDGSDTESNGSLPWFDWLLTRGNRFIIYNYRYEPIVSPSSRSGKGLMIPDDTQSWRVPTEFSGTLNSHWLIKAIQREKKYLQSEYGKIIDEVIKS